MSESKVAIVTGAGSGVGRDSALLLAEAGYAVVLVGRTLEKLRATEALMREEGGDPKVLLCAEDLADPQVPQRIVDAAVQALGRIDVLCNIAGAAPLQPIDRITPGVWRQNVDINLSAPVLLTAAAWPVFKRQKAGFVANVSSMASIDPFPGFSIYAAAKIGLNMFTRCTADEGRKIGVRAVCIAPGAIETPMLRQNFGEKVIPTDRTLDPADVAAMIVACLTGDRDFKPGGTIVLASP
jgi:NAD(P)-dependent dehydrogenase (short-subunit alcohol dehydrogenase family)